MSPIAFFRRELAPSHRRFVEAARTATKATLTTGLAATMQIAGPFGPLFAFRIGQPGISLGLFEGTITIAFAAVIQAAIVPITGKLLDYPGLIMGFLFLVFATMGYLLSNTRLFLILALVAIGTITTLYVGIFEPTQIGWGSAYTFDGILVATLVMVVIDMLIWPSPPEPRLLESIAADLDRTRARLELVGQHYLDPYAAPLPAPQVVSMLARNLMLLKSVKDQTNPTPLHLAALIEAVMTAEHAYLEVERLAVLVEEPVKDESTESHREEIELVLQTLDGAFAGRAEDIISGEHGVQHSQEWISELRAAIQHLSQSSTQARQACDQFMESGQSKFLGYIRGLEAIGNLLESRELISESAISDPTDAETDFEQRRFFDPAAFRFSIKLGAAITLGLIVGLTTQRADLQTILWSTVVAGQPNQYGAVIRKTILRLAGCALGGLAALGTMILVSENFDSLPAYLAAIFAMTMVSTYLAQSDEWLGYAGIQAGITFLICYVGLGPTTNVYRPLWRFWGIILGVLTTGFVFMVLWPEFASDEVIESLAKLMRTTLGFGREVAERLITEGRIAAVERQVSADLLEVLNLADQARLEGRRGATNSAAAIEAASIVVRIAYQFEIIARERMAGSSAQPEGILEHQEIFEQECCAALGVQLAKLELNDSHEHPSQSSAPPVLTLSIIADDLAFQSSHLPPESQIILTPQLESYRRLPILHLNLDSSLSRIAI